MFQLKIHWAAVQLCLVRVKYSIMWDRAFCMFCLLIALHKFDFRLVTSWLQINGDQWKVTEPYLLDRSYILSVQALLVDKEPQPYQARPKLYFWVTISSSSLCSLFQELLVYLAMFIRTEPQLFLEMLRLRVGLIIQVSVIYVYRNCQPTTRLTFQRNTVIGRTKALLEIYGCKFFFFSKHKKYINYMFKNKWI